MEQYNTLDEYIEDLSKEINNIESHDCLHHLTLKGTLNHVVDYRVEEILPYIELGCSGCYLEDIDNCKDYERVYRP